jgi:hypothetical protein
MKLFQKLLLPLLLSPLLFFGVGSVHSESAHSDREKILDREILSIYKDLSRARELLSYDSLSALPNNTTVTYIGKFPNRSGIKIKKFLVDTDPGNKGKMKTSDEKSIQLEFNGSILARVEVTVITEDVQIQQKSKTMILDSSPLDDTINDIEISFSGIDGSNKFLLSDLSNDGIKAERNDFKKDFYIKFLLDFHSQISTIIEAQKERGLKGQKNMLKQLNGSLKY